MSIAGAGLSLVGLLRRKYFERQGDLDDLTFSLFTTSDFDDAVVNHVTLFLYRVDVDPARRHRDLSPLRPGQPQRWSLSVELRYLLTVWGNNAATEHRVLEECMSILDTHAMLSGDLLDTTFAWGEGASLTVALESMPTEDMMRIWDSLSPSYRLSIPYLVRTVLLQPTERTDAPVVDSRTNHYLPGGPR